MSDLPSKTATVGAHEYTCSALPMEHWGALGEFLAGLLGDPAAQLVQGFQSGAVLDMVLDADEGALAQLLAVSSEKLTARNLRDLCAYMGKCLHVDDGNGHRGLTESEQNMWWAHHRAELPGVVALFLRTQYEDFFSGFAGMLPAKKSDAAKPSSTKADEGSES